VTVFQPDAGVDTGPIVVQRGGVRIDPTDTAGSLYFQKLYSLGLEAVLDAVAAIDDGSARPRPQDEALATFQGLVDDEAARIDWAQPAVAIDRLIRGCDPQPGAHAQRAGEVVRMYGSRLGSADPVGAPGTVMGFSDGRAVLAALGGTVEVERVRIGSGGKLPPGEAGLGIGDELA
jgi:methionyl-tRNA formyltransferase